MKRILCLGMLALTGVLATERQAPAWVNSKFSIGLNWHWQSGNNSILWGLVKDGQPPGPEFFNPYGGHGYHPGFAVQPGGQDFQFFGVQRQQQPGLGQPASTPTPPPLPPTTAQQAYGYQAIPAWSNQNVYQPVSYNPYYYTPNYMPTYYAPSYYYPSYWYGR